MERAVVAGPEEELPPAAVKFAHAVKWCARAGVVACGAAVVVAGSVAEIVFWIGMTIFNLWASLAFETLANHPQGVPNGKRHLVPRVLEDSMRKHLVYNTAADASRLRRNVWFLAAAAGIAAFGVTFENGQYFVPCATLAAAVALAGVRAS